MGGWGKSSESHLGTHGNSLKKQAHKSDFLALRFPTRGSPAGPRRINQKLFVIAEHLWISGWAAACADKDNCLY